MLLSKQFYIESLPILVAVDCIILGFDHERLKLLLFKRKVEPFKEEWSLIGSFVHPDEGVKEAAVRVLEANTGLKDIFMRPLGFYGEVDRDPGARVVALPFFALIKLHADKIKIVENYHAQWFDLNEIPDLILDHNHMVTEALEKLRREARYKPIGFNLLPAKFTIPQLQKLYEAIYNKKLDPRNFRKKITTINLLEKLNEKDKTTSRKGAFLYQFNQKNYLEMIEKGIDIQLT